MVKKGGIIWREGYILEGTSIYIRGEYSGRAGSILGGWDRLFLSVAYSRRKGEYILEGNYIFWERHFI